MPKISAASLPKHREETIDKLLDAWGDAVMTLGYDQVSFTEIASKAGIARTAIYNYFPDREAILFAWTDREVKKTMQNFHGQIAKASSCAKKLRVFVKLQLESFASRHLPPGQEAMQFMSPANHGRFAEHLEPIQRELRQIIELGVKKGEFATVDPDTMVPLVMACIGSERIPIATKAHTVDKATDEITQFLLRALVAKD